MSVRQLEFSKREVDNVKLVGIFKNLVINIDLPPHPQFLAILNFLGIAIVLTHFVINQNQSAF